MKVAIPIFNSRVSPRFDFAQKILIAVIKDKKVVERQEFSLINLNPIRRSVLLCELEVHTLICGGISSFSQRLIKGNRINIVPMIQGEIEEVLNLFISGNLISTIMPISQGKRYKQQRGRRGRCRDKGNRFIPH